MRQIKDPLKVFEDLPNHYAQTNIAFSPDEQLILTGTSIERDSTTGGLLCFYDRTKLELVSRVGISPTFSVVQCAWHPKLNQVNTKCYSSFITIPTICYLVSIINALLVPIIPFLCFCIQDLLCIGLFWLCNPL